MKPFAFHPLFLGLLLASCGGSVEGPPGGDGGAGGAQASGASGGGAGGAQASSASGGGAGGAQASSGGGAPVVCGGRSGGRCSPEEFCDFPDDSCGTFDSEGQCAIRPPICTGDCPGVCGCDGQFYCNACMAQSAGVDVLKDGACAEAGDVTYAAYYWAGGYDHLVVSKADPATDLCVRIYAEAPVAEARDDLDVSLPERWAVSRVTVREGTAGCAPGPEMPALSRADVNATGASGFVSWEGTPGSVAPCSLDLDVMVTFAALDGPATEHLQATGVAVNGACP